MGRRRLAAWAVLAGALLGCGGGDFSSSDAGGGGGGSNQAASSSGATMASGGGMPGDGCSDGSRELFVDAAAEPAIAGCSGGFQIAGVTTPESRQLHCNGTAGDTSDNPAGIGCSVADLCANGWHVCVSAADVADSSSTGMCDTAATAVPSFWITRQTQDGTGECIDPPMGDNNLVGCGALGRPAPASCAPLVRALRFDDCPMTVAWQCGLDDMAEATHVVKIGPEGGGALCCRNKVTDGGA